MEKAKDYLRHMTVKQATKIVIIGFAAIVVLFLLIGKVFAGPPPTIEQQQRNASRAAAQGLFDPGYPAILQ